MSMVEKENAAGRERDRERERKKISTTVWGESIVESKPLSHPKPACLTNELACLVTASCKKISRQLSSR